MTAEQLEELLNHIEVRKSHFGLDLMPISAATVASLARRVLAAEKLVEAGGVMANALKGNYIVPGSATAWDDALTAYREASK